MHSPKEKYDVRSVLDCQHNVGGMDLNNASPDLKYHTEIEWLPPKDHASNGDDGWGHDNEEDYEDYHDMILPPNHFDKGKTDKGKSSL